MKTAAVMMKGDSKKNVTNTEEGGWDRGLIKGNFFIIRFCLVVFLLIA